MILVLRRHHTIRETTGIDIGYDHTTNATASLDSSSPDNRGKGTLDLGVGRRMAVVATKWRGVHCGRLTTKYQKVKKSSTIFFFGFGLYRNDDTASIRGPFEKKELPR